MNISILGAGAFGKALGKILQDNQHQISYFDPIAFPQVTLAQATAQAEAIVIAIPSSILTDFMETYPTELKSIPTIIATKGLSDLALFQNFTRLSASAGPAFAQEIISGKPATFTASDQLDQQLFANAQITVEVCGDLLGILLCGSLKNLYAIGAGYFSDSESNLASYIESAHVETKAYLQSHGANPATAELACGIGDLILTCSNDTSRNLTCGKRLKTGQSLAQITTELGTVEGVSAARRIDVKGYPLLQKVVKLVYNQN